ncbi:hypothetical protein [Gorillibacterium massiliense]|uniref:hypothetical protein n=1 Tax=Gorillibacterium massiliense TaxID=1280390 RepID=UPI0004B3479A|nr:hypothetical protein [Gorillibacterium massiliense]
MQFISGESARLELFITLQLNAAGKNQALQEAGRLINAETVGLDRIWLADQEGARHLFRVMDIKYLQWFHVQPTDVSRRYLVSGRIELVLLEVREENQGEEPIRWRDLRLIESRFSPKPVLILTVGSEKLAVLVNRQLLKWAAVGSYREV